jgi:hypothetical protein
MVEGERLRRLLKPATVKDAVGVQGVNSISIAAGLA